MIIYFADRFFNILGLASTDLTEGLSIIADKTVEQVSSGVKTFDAELLFDDMTRADVERYTEPANYVLRSDGINNEFYTIIDTTIDIDGQTASIYCEDAGLDMLNDVCGAYEATEAMSAADYIAIFAYDSGFEIGINEISDKKRKLAWEGEATAAERILSVCTEFDNAELSFSFEIRGLVVIGKYINIWEKRGGDYGVELRLNRELSNIKVTKSANDLATALLPIGAEELTLQGYAYDDGDIYSPKDSLYLYSRSALAKFSRLNWESGAGAGDLIKMYSNEKGTTQSTLCAYAVSELKKHMDIAVNYEVTIADLGDNSVGLGDIISIVDDKGELYLRARIQKIEHSVCNDEINVTLGDYLITTSGISDKIAELQDKVSSMSFEAPTANVVQTEDGAIITIIDKSGTTTAEVTNGTDGENGYSPTVSTGSDLQGNTTLIVTNESGTTTTALKDQTARTSAATAQSDATQALSDASDAADKAEAATAAAEKASQVVYSTTTPTVSEYTNGATWYKTDANGTVIEVYVKSDNGWEKTEYTATTLDMNSVQDSLVRVGAESGARVEIDNDSVDIYVNPSTIGASLDGQNGLTVSNGGLRIVSALLKFALTLTTAGFNFINNVDATVFPFKIGSNNNNVHLNTYSDALAIGGKAETTFGVYASGLPDNQSADIVMKAGVEGGSSIDLQADNVLVNGNPISSGGGVSNVAVSLGKKDNSTGTQSIGTTITKLNIGTTTTVNSDSSGEYFEITSGQIKFKKAGVVLINSSVYVTHGNTAGYVAIYLYKNGTESISQLMYAGSGGALVPNIATVMTVSANDYVDIRGRANVNSTFYTDNKATTLDAVYLSVI